MCFASFHPPNGYFYIFFRTFGPTLLHFLSDIHKKYLIVRQVRQILTALQDCQCLAEPEQRCWNLKNDAGRSKWHHHKFCRSEWKLASPKNPGSRIITNSQYHWIKHTGTIWLIWRNFNSFLYNITFDSLRLYFNFVHFSQHSLILFFILLTIRLNLTLTFTLKTHPPSHPQFCCLSHSLFPVSAVFWKCNSLLSLSLSCNVSWVFSSVDPAVKSTSTTQEFFILPRFSPWYEFDGPTIYSPTETSPQCQNSACKVKETSVKENPLLIQIFINVKSMIATMSMHRFWVNV